jgi:regulator of replication initiation timing
MSDDWHDKYVREVQRNHDLGLENARLKARLDGLVEAAENAMRSLDEHDYVDLRTAIAAAKGGE